MRRFNPERLRCCWCDAPFRNQSDLIAHQLAHRDTAEQAAGALKQAADTGLTLQQAAERAKTIADDLMGIGTVTARLDEQALRTLIEAATGRAAGPPSLTSRRR